MKLKYLLTATLVASSALVACAPVYTTTGQPVWMPPSQQVYSQPYMTPVYYPDTLPVLKDAYGNIVAVGPQQIQAFQRQRLSSSTAVPAGYYNYGQVAAQWPTQQPIYWNPRNTSPISWQ